MKQIDAYIIEKFLIDKDIDVSNIDTDISKNTIFSRKAIADIINCAQELPITPVIITSKIIGVTSQSKYADETSRVMLYFNDDWKKYLMVPNIMIKAFPSPHNYNGYQAVILYQDKKLIKRVEYNEKYTSKYSSIKALFKEINEICKEVKFFN